MNAEEVARSVGLQIKLKRRMAGLTANQLAHASGIAAEQVKDIEAGRTSASWSDRARIAWALGCEPSTLFGGLDEGSV